MHKKHVVNYLVLQKKETTVRRRLLLQVATLVKERASQLCLEWQITVVVVVEAGAGICREAYFAEGDDSGDQTHAPSTVAKTLWPCVHTRI